MILVSLLIFYRSQLAKLNYLLTPKNANLRIYALLEKFLEEEVRSQKSEGLINQLLTTLITEC
ncbi:hypothetical protein ACX27_07685 [Nostoc piscinale CENA21]|uniref:Uncharacterized protein n=1 Tax=Nostoc piscinale CENA21 TaxID=224013 RepID=A0A0M4TV32_9NOSO|nr:hypothetical protein ACX27_07685 [Nostoc piscinale CENA21]